MFDVSLLPFWICGYTVLLPNYFYTYGFGKAYRNICAEGLHPAWQLVAYIGASHTNTHTHTCITCRWKVKKNTYKPTSVHSCTCRVCFCAWTWTALYWHRYAGVTECILCFFFHLRCMLPPTGLGFFVPPCEWSVKMYWETEIDVMCHSVCINLKLCLSEC